MGKPFCLNLNIFSNTTIAASTTIPTANARPAKDITLIDLPRAAIATKDPITDTGMASDTTRVAEPLLKNSRSTMAANVPPI